MKIWQDLKKYNRGKWYPKGLVNIIFYINVLYRISRFFYKVKLFPISKIFWIFNRVLFGVDIDPRTQIGGGFKILHGVGIVIGHKAIIGNNFKIYQGVTIGGNSGKTRIYNDKLLHQPFIENDVTIHPNAIVIGPIVLGQNCEVGAGSIVTKDVPENAIIAGNPAKIMKIKE